MKIKSLLIIMLVSVMLAHEAQAHLKLKLLKAKLLAAKAPHVLAKIAVAKEVKVKSKIAAIKTIGAVKASKAALFSAITAPIRVAKKSFAIKVGAVKIAKALKVAKVAAVVASLKKHPIIVPVPFPIKVPFPFPIKKGVDIFKTGPLAAGAGLLGGLGAGTLGGLGAGALSGLGSGALSGLGSGVVSGALSGKAAGFNPVHGLISGAQHLIKSTGVKIPFLPIPQSIPVAQPAYIQAAPEPVYRFVPNGFSNYNNVQYSPNINVEYPAAYENSGSSQVTHSTYGLPNQ